MNGPGTQAGSEFGPYRLLRLLGRGGMGEVYEAEDTRKHRVVALKLISEQFSGDPVFRARIQREADTAGRLTEPHVVPIHDYGEINGRYYVEMRLIDGTDLRALLRRHGPLTPARAVAIVRQIAAALDAAHGNGVTHRDVKPENILITSSDFAYLVDFGIARAANDPGLTQTGTAMGTYNYMAPERFTDDEVTYRADIYALACVLGECLTGSPPYRANSVERLIAAHLMDPAPRPSDQLPGQVPVALDHVVAKGMAKNPNDRYTSAGEFADAALEALTAPEQNQAATILRKGEEETLRSPIANLQSGPQYSGAQYAPQQYSGAQQYSGPQYAAPGPVQHSGAQYTGGGPPAPSDATQARPVVPAGSWRAQPQHPSTPQPMQPAGPPTFTKTPGLDDDAKRKRLLAVAAVALVVVVGAAAFFMLRPSHKGGAAEAWDGPAGEQTVLPFDGLNFRLSPGGVALDGDGNVYATNQGMYGKVVKLAPGSDAPTVLPFSGLYEPQGLAVDGSGAVYVSDFNNRVVKLTQGANTQTELPFTGLLYPEGVAVDETGNVYVADRGNDRVVKLDEASNAQSVLPFGELDNPDGVTVDGGGNVYVTDTDKNRVLKLAAGAAEATEMPFSGLSVPWGITVGSDGALYVTEHSSHKVLKLPAGANSSTEVPFQGLNTPLDVEVAPDGTLYIADRGNNRVVRLKP